LRSLSRAAIALWLVAPRSHPRPISAQNLWRKHHTIVEIVNRARRENAALTAVSYIRHAAYKKGVFNIGALSFNNSLR
jgi:hypothetical protein